MVEAIPNASIETTEYECSVCSEYLQPEGDHIPINLPCGHCYCLVCVESIRKQARQSGTPYFYCPECRGVQSVDAQLAKSYKLIEILQRNVNSSLKENRSPFVDLTNVVGPAEMSPDDGSFSTKRKRGRS